MTEQRHAVAIAAGYDPLLDDLEAPEPHVPTSRLMVFVISGRTFACEMSAIREVVPSQTVTRLPGAPKEVCGLVNLRGTIVTVIDVGYKLSQSSCNPKDGLILLADHGEKLVGLSVDDVRDILDVPIDKISAFEGVVEAGSHIVTAVAELDGAEVMVLDIKAVISEILG